MRCVIIAGSPDYDVDLIKQTVKENDFVICADRGYVYAQKSGIVPNLIVGDFDSAIAPTKKNCDIIKLNSHKDDTDTLHCVNLALDKGYSEIVILCGIGGRTDHTFANVATLQYIANKKCKGSLISNKEQIFYLSKGEYSYKEYNNITFSLFPFGCEKVNVTYSGVEYPLNNYSLCSDIPMGISNVFITDDSEIKINYGNAILVINLTD